MNQRYDVLGFGLIAFAVALFAVTGTSDNLFTDQSWLYRYQSLLGAMATVLAGWLAFYAVQRQIAHSQQRLLQSQAAAKVAAVMALTQPVHAAATALSIIRAAYAVADSITSNIAEDRVIDRCIDHLATTLEHFSLKEIARDLDSDSRALYLGIVLRLNSFVTISKNPATDMSRWYRLRLHIQTLEGTHHYVALFDADLGRKFAEDGEMSVADRDPPAVAA